MEKTTVELEKEISEITNTLREINEHLDEQDKKLEPMYKIFINVDGAFNVSKWILIGLGVVGAGLGGLYLVINELRMFWKAH